MVLIDGHNLIGRTPGLSLEREAEGREVVLRRVGAWAAGRGDRVVVVFDGDRPGAAGQGAFGALRVVYAPAGGSADQEILKRARPGTTVVTSDRGLAREARERGARVESSEAFRRRLGPAPRPDRDETKPEAEEDPEFWLRLFEAGRHKI